MTCSSLASVPSLLVAVLLAGCRCEVGVLGRRNCPPQSKPIDFDRDVKPIFAKHCVSCHGPDKQKNGMRLRWDAHLEETGEHQGAPHDSFLVSPPISSIYENDRRRCGLFICTPFARGVFGGDAEPMAELVVHVECTACGHKAIIPAEALGERRGLARSTMP